MRNRKIGVICTHPVQYYVPWYRALSGLSELELTVFFCHEQTAEGQAEAGFSVPFEWDIPLLNGYKHQFLKNVSKNPNVFEFSGCDNPEISPMIREGGFDAFIVQGWYVKGLLQAIWSCWRSKTPVIIRGDSHLLTQRSKLKRILKYPFFRLLIPRFDAYLVVGELSKSYYEAYGARPERMFFAPHCVDNDFFASKSQEFQNQKGRVRKEFGLEDGSIVFLFAGKLTEIKRPFDFLNAVCLASRKIPNISALIVGDGPLRRSMEEYASKKGIKVAFTGFLNQSRMPEAYAAADCLVLCSYEYETWGLVVNEAMASGLPVIVSDRVGCGPDLVVPGKTGMFFQHHNIPELAGVLEQLASDPKGIKEMGSNAAEHIKGYSLEKLVAGTLSSINAVCDNYEE